MAQDGFVPMTSIQKKPDRYVGDCSSWVATEKVHGSSFQLYTSDGQSVKVGSRRQTLDKDGSFLRCSIKDILQEYQDCALKLWHIVHSEDNWTPYRAAPVYFEEDDDGGADDGDDDDDDDDGDDDGNEVEEKLNQSENHEENNECHVRIYGELYGGGGINKELKRAVQKEIIYCDDFRFYVFGCTINYRWVTITELNDLCQRAGFPYYAKPVCEPKPSPDELKEWLTQEGFIRSRSALTEKEGDEKTSMEGVVMTPLTRPDFRLHAVKFLFPAFNDVREAQFGQSKTSNFCTKQRYHSVISKLNIHEREDTEMVVDLFIADIIKESSNKNPSQKLRGIWSNLVTKWLTEDGYVKNTEGGPKEDGGKINGSVGNKKEDEKEKEQDEDEEMGLDFFGL